MATHTLKLGSDHTCGISAAPAAAAAAAAACTICREKMTEPAVAWFWALVARAMVEASGILMWLRLAEEGGGPVVLVTSSVTALFMVVVTDPTTKRGNLGDPP